VLLQYFLLSGQGVLVGLMVLATPSPEKSSTVNLMYIILNGDIMMMDLEGLRV
jgi:hypothetical protein